MAREEKQGMRVPEIYCMMKIGKYLFIIMEYVHGQTIWGVLEMMGRSKKLEFI